MYRFFFNCLLFSLLSFSFLLKAEDNLSPAGIASNSEPLPIKDIRLFVRVLELIKRNSVEKPKDSDLIRMAISGMLTKLDPHSSFLNQKSLRSLEEQTKGNYAGLGISVGVKDGLILVVSPLDDSPAFDAGVHSGDLIYQVNGRPVRGMKLDEVVKNMRGKPGSSVSISVLRKGKNKPLDFQIQRRVISLQTANAKILKKDYLYIRLSSFAAHTDKEMIQAVQKLGVPKNHWKGIVLDLRDNPGGVLQTAVAVSDAFLDGGVVVSMKGQSKNQSRVFEAKSERFFGVIPLVVLINAGSASASEIVAGAIQDRKRGLIVGTQSFGKGSVQTIMPVSADEAIRLTTALYYTPNNRSIQAKGIEPDIEIKPAKLSFIDEGFRIHEKDLNGHLKNPKETQSATQILKTMNHEELDDSNDYQLNQALNILKVLSLQKTSLTIN